MSQRLLIGVVSVFVCIAGSLRPAAQSEADVQRTVYFTARHDSGGYVADLTSADLTVKEGGKERRITRLEPSDMRLKVCLAIDEGLSPDATLRQALARFIQQILGTGDVALYLLGRGNVKLVDYSAEPALFANALKAFPLRAQGDGNLVESLFELAKGQRSLEGRRVIVVLATEVPQRSTVTANGVLDQLRDNGAVLHAATLAGLAGIDAPTPESPHLEVPEETERDRALNDGTRQSGGLRLSSPRIEGFPALLDRIRNELLNQYVVTYVMPAGSKSDGHVGLTTSRKGITLRAPSQLPKL